MSARNRFRPWFARTFDEECGIVAERREFLRAVEQHLERVESWEERHRRLLHEALSEAMKSTG